MEDAEDIKKMNALLESEKQTFNLEFEDFVINDSDDEVAEISYSVDDIDLEHPNFDISNLSSYQPTLSLTTSERLIVDSCSDVELKNLMILNRQKSIKLMFLYKKVKDLLLECRQNIVAKSDQVKQTSINVNRSAILAGGTWKLSAPYFKDRSLFPCPINADVKTRQQNKELSVYDLYSLSKWSDVETKNLLNAVKLNYKLNVEKEMTKKISILKKRQSVQKNGEDKFEKEISQLESCLEMVKERELIPSLGSDENIDWFRIADVFLKEKHSAEECKSFWHVYLHPDINKSNWTVEENNQIKKLVKKFKLQNWDRIAKELGTNRTGFVVCVHYMTYIHKRFKKSKFTPTEDEKLKRLANMHKVGNKIRWSKVVQHFKDRSRDQLFHRYTYFLAPEHIHHEKFTSEEDVLLLILVNKYGKSFRKCAEFFPGRSQSQLKSRFNCNLQGDLKKGCFTKEDDEIILNYVKEYGTKKWSGLTSVLQRCRGQIRQRYCFLNRYFEKNPNGDLDDVPRRKHTAFANQNGFPFLRYVADKFTHFQEIPTLTQIKAVIEENSKSTNTNEENADDVESKNEKLVKKKSTKTVVKKKRKETFEEKPFELDDMLLDFFCNSYKSVSVPKYVSGPQIVEAINNVDTLLKLLNVQLDIPDDVENDSRIDILDKTILVSLAERQKNKNKEPNELPLNIITTLVPPNLNNLIGIRSLLIKYKSYKSTLSKTDDAQIFDPLFPHSNRTLLRVEQFLDQLSPDKREIILAERLLFYKRFHSLFKLASILTLHPPEPDLQLSSSNVQLNEMPEYKVVRTYGRKKSIEPSPKRIKLEIEAASSKNNEIVKNNTNQTISSFERDISEAGCSYMNEEHFEDNVDLNDMEDLKKLNMFLKTEDNLDDSDIEL